MGPNEMQQLLGGVNPFKEIPGLWFELYKTQYFVQCILNEAKTVNTHEKILEDACNFSMEQVRKKFPGLDCQLTKKQPEKPTETEVKE